MTTQTTLKQTFEASEVDSIYAELGTLVVPLDGDPLQFGPKRLNLKVSLVRRALDRTEKLFLDISHRLQVARRSLRIAEVDFELAKKHLFANDPETRAGRSFTDRDAIAAGKLRKEVDTLNDLKILVMDLEAVLDVIKAKRADLKGTEGRLKDQLQLCREEIGLGHRWGSQVPEAMVDLQQGRSAIADLKQVDDLLGMVDGEVHLATKQGDWVGPQTEAEEIAESVVEAPAVQVNPVITVKPVEPIVAPAPIIEIPVPAIDDLPEAGDPDKIPEASSTTASVDAFLDGMPMEGMKTPKEIKGAKDVALVDDGLLSFLSDFESLV